jgi:hypothetical protein
VGHSDFQSESGLIFTRRSTRGNAKILVQTYVEDWRAICRLSLRERACFRGAKADPGVPQTAPKKEQCLKVELLGRTCGTVAPAVPRSMPPSAGKHSRGRLGHTGCRRVTSNSTFRHHPSAHRLTTRRPRKYNRVRTTRLTITPP